MKVLKRPKKVKKPEIDASKSIFGVKKPEFKMKKPVFGAKNRKEARNLLRPTPVHEKMVIRAGLVAIGVNLLLTVFKLVISVMSGSLAILSDALHGLVDTLSGIVVIVSEKIKPWTLKKAQNRNKNGAGAKDKITSDIKSENSVTKNEVTDSTKTVVTHKDIERIGSCVIAVIILVVAVHLLLEAIENLNEPSEVNFSAPMLVILVASAITKIGLGFYLRRASEKVQSATLKASSVETLNDSIISIAVLISAFAYICWQVDIEAPVSIVVAIFIAKSGLDLLLGRE